MRGFRRCPEFPERRAQQWKTIVDIVGRVGGAGRVGGGIRLFLRESLRTSGRRRFRGIRAGGAYTAPFAGGSGRLIRARRTRHLPALRTPERFGSACCDRDDRDAASGHGTRRFGLPRRSSANRSNPFRWVLSRPTGCPRRAIRRRRGAARGTPLALPVRCTRATWGRPSNARPKTSPKRMKGHRCTGGPSFSDQYCERIASVSQRDPLCARGDLNPHALTGTRT